MRKPITFAIIILLSNLLLAQNTLDELPQKPTGYSNYLNKLKLTLINLQKKNCENVSEKTLQQDLIVGQNDPNEILTISGNCILDGNLFIVNNGQLILDSANFQINGNISILHNGRLEANGGSFKVIQDYIYEHEVIIWNTGELQFNNINFSSSGQSWSVTVADSASYILQNSEITDGFITTGIVGHGSSSITGTEHLGNSFALKTVVLKLRIVIGC